MVFTIINYGLEKIDDKARYALGCNNLVIDKSLPQLRSRVHSQIDPTVLPSSIFSSKYGNFRLQKNKMVTAYFNSSLKLCDPVKYSNPTLHVVYGCTIQSNGDIHSQFHASSMTLGMAMPV